MKNPVPLNWSNKTMEIILPNSTFSIPNCRSVPPTSPLRRLCGRRRFTAEIEEIRVCTNRTCRRQGSLQTLETLTGVAPANVAVKSCGCLGRCGAGPNLVALPEGVLMSHCGTAARAAEVLLGLCGGGVLNSDHAKKSLEALALRKKAEKEMEDGNFSEAELLLSQVLPLLSGNKNIQKCQGQELCFWCALRNFHGSVLTILFYFISSHCAEFCLRNRQAIVMNFYHKQFGLSVTEFGLRKLICEKTVMSMYLFGAGYRIKTDRWYLYYI